MAPNDLREQIDQREFQPVRLYVSDGATYDLFEQSYARVHVTTLRIGLEPDEEGLPSRTLYIDARHVTQVEMLPSHGKVR